MFTRSPASPVRGRRRPLTVVLIVVGAIYLLLTVAGTLWTDYMWFDSVGFSRVWAKNWSWSIFLGGLGVLIAFTIFWLTLVAVDRFSPKWMVAPDDDELGERVREWMEPRAQRLQVIVAMVLALLLGLAASSWRHEVFLFNNRQPFGTADPIFGVDIEFYVFRLPLMTTVVDWMFNLLVMATVLAAVAFYMNGGLRFDGRRIEATRGAKIQLSVMLAMVALVRAASYWLDRYEILYSTHTESGFFGPGYTDINARLPVLNLLLIVALIAAVLFVVNIFRRGWTLAAVSVASWMLVAVAAGSIYPAVIQRFEVLPNQLPKETPYLTNNLEATRAAYMLEDITVRPFSASSDLTIEDIEANQLTIENLRIWNTSVLLRTYQNFQELEPYYVIGRVDTDRYLDEGQPHQVMVGVREVDEIDLPRDDWQNTHLFYTHGYGAVVNQANAVQSDGQPRFLLRDLPPASAIRSLQLTQPRVYFGETYEPGRPVIVKTGGQPQEIDLPLTEGIQYNEYDGAAGVQINGFLRRLAFAFRYRDLNLLISGEIRSDSRVLVERNVRRIVDTIAPFLVSDSDPYPVILNGEILWVLDMYTTTSFYPYAEPVTGESLERLSVTSGMPRGTNYIRNSVKAVIGAHDGDVTFYVSDNSDPLIRAWSRNYPGMFVDQMFMPAGLDEHLRYPQDLFRLQSYHYLEYHVTQPSDLFTGNDAWSFPEDSSTAGRIGDQRIRADAMVESEAKTQVLPYYLLTELPDDDELSYLLLQPFNPRARRNMVGFLVADSTPGRYGRLIDFRMPQGDFVDGVGQVGQRIEQDAEISQQLSLWDQSGSRVVKGDLLVVPIEDSVIYFQPIYLEEAGGAFPEFRRVVVVFGERVEWDDTLEGALARVFGASTNPPDNAPPGVGGDLEELIGKALDAFANANAALARGDLAEYQEWINTAEQIVKEIEDLLNEDPSAGLGGTLSALLRNMP